MFIIIQNNFSIRIKNNNLKIVKIIGNKANIKYTKCGIILSGLADKHRSQDYLWPIENIERSQLTKVIDNINFKFDKQSVRFATQPLSPIWEMKQSRKSQSFTTSWKELLVVN